MHRPSGILHPLIKSRCGLCRGSSLLYFWYCLFVEVVLKIKLDITMRVFREILKTFSEDQVLIILIEATRRSFWCPTGLNI